MSQLKHLIGSRMYNWEHKDWPHFRYSTAGLQAIAIEFAQELGVTNGLIETLDAAQREETLVEILIAEAMKTSEIEGEYMSREDVMSSIKLNLGLKDRKVVTDQKVAGVSQLMTTVRKDVHKKLTSQMIMDWHQVLMEGYPKINAGLWRKGDEVMQVISGAYGKEIVHFEAPPSNAFQGRWKTS